MASQLGRFYLHSSEEDQKQSLILYRKGYTAKNTREDISTELFEKASEKFTALFVDDSFDRRSHNSCI